MNRVIVAGHLCLDIIPQILTSTPLEPGQLVDTGPTMFSTGGAVANVGLALTKLGSEVALVGKVGEDPFGDSLCLFLAGFGEGLTQFIHRSSEAQTSHSIVISQSGRDRTFLHHPGCNHHFGIEDIEFATLPEASWFHFGYPPLMRRMYVDGGVELAEIFRRAKQKGLTTSLDMSLPDSNGDSGRADWLSILAQVLPHVDYFVPSQEEAVILTRSSDPAAKSLELGAKNVILKRGTMGLFWTDGSNSHRQPILPVEVVGTTGSGDATIAGFIYGMTNGYPVEESMKIGCAVGACCCEGADAVSGIQNWAETQKRFSIQQPSKR